MMERRSHESEWAREILFPCFPSNYSFHCLDCISCFFLLISLISLWLYKQSRNLGTFLFSSLVPLHKHPPWSLPLEYYLTNQPKAIWRENWLYHWTTMAQWSDPHWRWWIHIIPTTTHTKTMINTSRSKLKDAHHRPRLPARLPRPQILSLQPNQKRKDFDFGAWQKTILIQSSFLDTKRIWFWVLWLLEVLCKSFLLWWMISSLDWSN